MSDNRSDPIDDITGGSSRIDDPEDRTFIPSDIDTDDSLFNDKSTKTGQNKENQPEGSQTDGSQTGGSHINKNDTLVNRLSDWANIVQVSRKFLDEAILPAGQEAIRAKFALRERQRQEEEAKKNESKKRKRDDDKPDLNDDSDRGEGPDPGPSKAQKNASGKNDEEQGPPPKKQKLNEGSGSNMGGKGNGANNTGKSNGQEKTPGQNKFSPMEIDSPLSSPPESEQSEENKANTTDETGQPKQDEKMKQTQQMGNPDLPRPIKRSDQPKNTTQSYEYLDNIALEDIELTCTKDKQAIQQALNARKINRPLNKPKGLLNINSRTCFANSVLQCLAATLEPKWLKKSLGNQLQYHPKKDGDPIYPQFDALFYILQGIQGGDIAHFQNTRVKGMLEAWDADAKRVSDTNPFAVHINLDGENQQDCHEFLERILNCFKGGPYPPPHEPAAKDVYEVHPLMDALFLVQNYTPYICGDPSCKFEIPRTDDGKLFMTIFPSESMEDRPVRLVDVLRHMKKSLTETFTATCEKCNTKNEHTSTWVGLTHLPEILILRVEMLGTKWDGKYVFDNETQKHRISKETGKRIKVMTACRRRYIVQPHENLDLADYVASPMKRTKYALRAFIKHDGLSADEGHYFAYTQDPQKGIWWEWNDTTVKAVTFDQALQGIGQTYIMFYDRLPEDPESS